MSQLYDELAQAIAPLKTVFEQATTSTPIQLTPQLQPNSPIAHLCNTLQLNIAQRDLLLLSLMLELLPEHRSVAAQLQGNPQARYCTYALAKTLLTSFDWNLLHSYNPLTYWRILTPQTSQSLGIVESPLQLDPYIVNYVLGDYALDPQLSHLLRPITEVDPIVAQLPSTQAALHQTQAFGFPGLTPSNTPHLLLSTQSIFTRRQVAAALAQQCQRPLYRLSFNDLPANPSALRQSWERQALLTHSLLVLETDSLVTENPEQRQRFYSFVNECCTPLILSHPEPLSLPERQIYDLELNPLTVEERQHLWMSYLGDRATPLKATLTAIAEQFPLPAEAISTLANQLSSTDTPQHLWRICRQSARPHLEDLAQRIETQLTWDDLVFPDDHRQQLKGIVAAVRQRATVYQDWGFAHRENRGLGIIALFSGPSGTGKTTAAEIIARELELDCYRVDLSNIVNKYIGETEKNLKRVFDAAEGSGAMLLFDEADAIFGMRGEVKDARDRYANQEVSYLLQRLETYPGIAILTTNLRKSIDDAFMRRLRYVVDFPEPEEVNRQAIWEQVFPDNVPCQDLSYSRLAKLRVTGGNIRNIALTAAFLAADTGEPVTMALMEQAARAEYKKIGRSLSAPESSALKGKWPPRL